jgi:hypothetical protein
MPYLLDIHDLVALAAHGPEIDDKNAPWSEGAGAARVVSSRSELAALPAVGPRCVECSTCWEGAQ